MGSADPARTAAAVLTTVALATGAAGCGGARVDKAGGSPAAKPLVLTLAAHDDDYAFGTFAAAVARLSRGSMRIRIADNWRATGDASEIDYERWIVADVRRGRVPLGIVGARIWDLLGVDSFRALVAPFLVDTLTLERQALESPLAARALARLDREGVVGIALLPGRLRRPLGVTRPLVRPQDYRGATIGIRLGGVAEATFRALSATAKGWLWLSDRSPHVDGFELDPLIVSENGYDEGARALTANVVFWPKPQTIVMNREAFEKLTPGQRQILRDAGREAVAPELARIARDQRLGVSILCTDGLALVTAGPADLAALRLAVRPVYDQLDADPLTRRWIESIRRMRAVRPAPPDTLRCP